MRGPTCIFWANLTPFSLEAALADQIILAVGIDQSITGEGRDRTNITLPGQQPELVSRIISLKKPTVLVLVNGGQLAPSTAAAGCTSISEPRPSKRVPESKICPGRKPPFWARVKHAACPYKSAIQKRFTMENAK